MTENERNGSLQILNKYEGNPILAPDKNLEWGCLVATNPGAWYDEEREEFILLYRAAGDDADHLIRIAIATSKDGFNFTRQGGPIFEPDPGAWDYGAMEDPRVVKFGEHYFITYAAVTYPPGRYWEREDMGRQAPDTAAEAPVLLRLNQTRTGLAITRDFKTAIRLGPISDQTLDDRNVIIFPEKVGGKFVTLHRPMQWVGKEYGTDMPAIWIAFSDDLLQNKELHLLAKAEYEWEQKIGGSAPPIKTEHGWFTLYHAVGPDSIYRVGAMMLDLENPAVVTHRTPEPILVPSESYEMEGFYKGICFPCGNVVKDGVLYVYYGGADQYVGVATADFVQLQNALLNHPV